MDAGRRSIILRMESAQKSRGEAGGVAASKRANTRRGWIADWRERHQTAMSFWLHMVGIPLALGSIPLAVWQLVEWRWDLWWRPAGMLALGYLLQWIGHRHEGNDVGEIIPIKRALGLPFVAISPRFAGSPQKRDR